MKFHPIALLTLLSLGCTAPQPESAPDAAPAPVFVEATSPEEEPSWTPPEGAVPGGDYSTDMNMNGVDDIIDIVTGTSLDEDLNGLPDDGEAMWVGATVIDH